MCALLALRACVGVQRTPAEFGCCVRFDRWRACGGMCGSIPPQHASAKPAHRSRRARWGVIVHVYRHRAPAGWGPPLLERSRACPPAPGVLVSRMVSRAAMSSEAKSARWLAQRGTVHSCCAGWRTAQGAPAEIQGGSSSARFDGHRRWRGGLAGEDKAARLCSLGFRYGLQSGLPSLTCGWSTRLQTPGRGDMTGGHAVLTWRATDLPFRCCDVQYRPSAG